MLLDGLIDQAQNILHALRKVDNSELAQEACAELIERMEEMRG